MPYRRLPNTDAARIRSLKQAVQHIEGTDINDLPFSLKTMEDAKIFLNSFESAVLRYKQAIEEQVSASKNYQALSKQARLYVSHFIQVLNLSIIRDEIKPDVKKYYSLNPDSYNIPDISTDALLLDWGDKIIIGEEKRINNGGTPIYSPAIAKVKVHYNLFRDAYRKQKIHQQTTARNQDTLISLRTEGDAIIIDLWNQIEDKFKELPSLERLEKCREYGIIYYYRKSEKKP